MGIANRPATCASCGARLRQKSWYYRNGKYFCKRRCWENEQAKVKEELAKVAQTKQQPAEAKAADAGKAEAPRSGASAEAPKAEAVSADTSKDDGAKAEHTTSQEAKTGARDKGGGAA